MTAFPSLLLNIAAATYACECVRLKRGGERSPKLVCGEVRDWWRPVDALLDCSSQRALHHLSSLQHLLWHLSVNLELDASNAPGALCSHHSPSARVRNVSGCSWLFPGRWESKITLHTNLQNIWIPVFLNLRVCIIKTLIPQDRTDKEAPSQGPVLSAVAFSGLCSYTYTGSHRGPVSWLAWTSYRPC